MSCDTVFYQFGADFFNRYSANQLGVHALDLQNNLAEFGFGSTTGIDLPSEKRRAPSPTPPGRPVRRQNPTLFNPGEQGWLPGDDIQMAIGQGDVPVTPLQMATAYAAIANGGKRCAVRISFIASMIRGATW